jgi:hypothetical protein
MILQGKRELVENEEFEEISRKRPLSERRQTSTFPGVDGQMLATLVEKPGVPPETVLACFDLDFQTDLDHFHLYFGAQDLE